ncbi:hypothetical protein QTP70_009738 [Hemibagrus guttatus]|uniref:Uncharacterized protein n=1 Tax=Hemibagrus guttatus TaxID=175788 RepID=A0AAE0UQC6_9TELE|nr:hypothetical protein QTP70_009738 [Hemibagrus guttatus]
MHLFRGTYRSGVGRCQILLENEISIFKMLVSRKKYEVLQNFLLSFRTLATNSVVYDAFAMFPVSPLLLGPAVVRELSPKQWLTHLARYENHDHNENTVYFENDKLLALDSFAIPCCVLYVPVMIMLVLATYTVITRLIYSI